MFNDSCWKAINNMLNRLIEVTFKQKNEEEIGAGIVIR